MKNQAFKDSYKQFKDKVPFHNIGSVLQDYINKRPGGIVDYDLKIKGDGYDVMIDGKTKSFSTGEEALAYVKNLRDKV